MKVLVKLLLIFTIIISFTLFLQQCSFASGMSADSMFGQAEQFVAKGGSGKISIGQVENDLMPIGNVLFGIAIAVLLVVGLIMGVKYMISGADERANMKQKLVWYVVAAVLVFSATAIYNVVYNIIKTATN